MKKISILVLLSLVINIFSTVTIYAEETTVNAEEFIKEKISPITDELKMSEEEVDKYLSEYDKADDFAYELIKYKKYIEHNPEETISFEDFKNNNYTIGSSNLYTYKAPRAAKSGTVLIPPEQQKTDYRNYTNISENERINYSTGELIYEETDLVLPGVNGLDLVLTSRFNQEESALYSPALVPTGWGNSPTYSTWMFGYTSEAEKKYGIGAGWSFAFSNVQKGDEEGTYYIRLADGSTLKAVYDEWEYKIEGRNSKDIEFERVNTSEYIVRYKNGTWEHFDDNGITMTEDKNGNEIQYYYSSDGLLEKIIDSANRTITFERTYNVGGGIDNILEVKLDGEVLCRYDMQEYSNGRSTLYEKRTKNINRLFFYKPQEVEVQVPMANTSDTNVLLTIDEVVNMCENNSFRYEYDNGTMLTENSFGSTGRKKFPRVIKRKTTESSYYTGEEANEVNYKYSGTVKYSQTPYKVIETIAQTGAETTYTSNHLGLITNKKVTVPDSDLTVSIDYTYDDYRFLESYTKNTYSGGRSYSVSESYENDEKGNVISHTDVFGTTRNYTYDRITGVIKEIEEPALKFGYAVNRYTVNTLDDHGNILNSGIGEHRDNFMQSVDSTYDIHGNILTKKTSPEYMAEESFEYTSDNSQISKYMRGDTVMAKYTYDNLGRKISETNSLGDKTQYIYNKNNEIVEIISPDDTNTKNLYGIDLGHYAQANIYCNEKGPVKKEYYDIVGRVTEICDTGLLESQYNHNNNYHYSDLADPDVDEFYSLVSDEMWKTKEKIRYDSIGRVTEVENELGTTKYEYDGFNRVVKQINPDLSEKRIEYDDIERTVTTYDEEGNKTVEKYDEADRVVSQTIFPNSSTPLTKSIQYDRTGLTASVTDYSGNTTEYENDILGRQIAITDATGEMMYTRYADDFSYTIECFSDDTIRQSSYYDEFGRLSAVADEYFNVNNYMYDTEGNLIESIDKNGDSTRYTYNSRSAVTNIATDDADKLYVYDETGKVRAVESRKENRLGNLEKDNRIQYNYRVDGLVNDETDFRLDGTSRVTFNTQYNKVGSPTSFTVRKDTGQEIKKTQYTRDEMDRVNNIGQTASGVQNKDVGCEYYANGWLKKENLPNGYSNNYIYDGAGRMTELNRLDANGVSELKYNYTYDNNGNRTKIVETEKSGRKVTTTYEYDKLNRLVKEVNGHSGNTTSYKFDVRNNIKLKTVSGTDNYTESYIYTSEHTDKYMSNRIIEVTKKSGNTLLGRTFYYQQPNGNTYKKIVTNEYGEPVETADYTYNSWNLMDSASVQKGNTKTDVTFKYDATNRRNGKITEVYENGHLEDSKTTEYIWYGDKVQYEEVTQNKQMSSNVNMWGMSGIAARNEELFSSDAHGNTDASYDGTKTVKRYTYDAYGNAIRDNEEDDNPYRYCGENYDEETGLYYLRARYYDPSI